MHLVPLEVPLRSCYNLVLSEYSLPRRSLRHRLHLGSTIENKTIFVSNSNFSPSPCSSISDCYKEEILETDSGLLNGLTSFEISSYSSSSSVVEDEVIKSDFCKGEASKGNRDSDDFAFMRLAEARAALGQQLNVEGILSSFRIVVSEPHVALPHARVPDIRYIDWEELRRRGFKGVVFDKDNTLTAPYSLTLWEPLGESIEQCKTFFGDDIAVFSNSAGLEQYDHDGKKATTLETALRIRVIRHKFKKPSGSCEEIEKHFNCKSSQLVMVGDRPFTDVVYGNRNGLFTILTEPFSVKEEPFIVRQVRKVESSILNYWCRRGLRATPHGLLSEPKQCVKDYPIS